MGAIAPYQVLDVCRFTINYSNSCGYGISNLKLQKILYFIQAYFLITTSEGTPCFGEKIEAWDFGPVVPEAYQEYKRYGSMNIPTITTYIETDHNDAWNIQRKFFNAEVISKEHRNMIATVVSSFKEYSATDLVKLTHMQAPWKKAYSRYKNREITTESIREYFK